MSYLIRKWHLPYEQDNDDQHDFKLKPNENWLENLRKVNILIGPNNSGKSRFLRHLFKLKYQMFSPVSFDLDRLIRLINKIKDTIRVHYEKRGISNIETAFRDIYLDTLMPRNFIINTKPPLAEINALMKGIREFVAGTIKIYSREHPDEKYIEFSFPIVEKISKIAEQIDEITSNIRGSYEFHKIYIPTLRGLRPFSNPGDWYRDRTQKDYFSSNPHGDQEIFTGLEMYKQVFDLYNGGEEERSLLTEYELFISEHFFEGAEVKLYPRRQSDVIFVKLGLEHEFPIHLLGDGIQQLIIITYPLFVNKEKNVLVFIEEPELYLHPGLQRRLLGLLTGEELGSVQTFLTTHSNHFLDMSLDYSEVSTHKCFKTLEQDGSNMQFFVENCSVKDRNIMALLGVKNSSVLLSNCTIWVEGITDRLYIRKYLEIYMRCKNDEEGMRVFEEDKHYSFVEYSGNNITHWSFLDNRDDGINVESLCGTLFLIADRDEDSRKNRRQKRLRQVLKDRYYRLECREIENLLSKDVLMATIRDFKNAVQKSDSKIKYSDYKREALGAFIDAKILAASSRKTFRASSGTLNCKVEFAKNAIGHINSLDDFSPEALKLVGLIYNFIKKHNQ